MKKMKEIIVKSGLLAFFLMVCQVSFAQDWANLGRFHHDDSLLAAPAPHQNRVVFMGNSITDYWISSSPAFFSENHYINRGIGGQTTPQMLIRFRQDVIDLSPKVVVILAGTNDIAGNTGPSTIDMIEDNLASMAQLAQVNDIQVVLSSVLPAYDYPWKKGIYLAKEIVELNRWIKDYCNIRGYVYLDYYSHLVDNKGGMKANLSKDGVHPNLAGYKVMEPLAVKAIEKALTR